MLFPLDPLPVDVQSEFDDPVVDNVWRDLYNLRPFLRNPLVAFVLLLPLTIGHWAWARLAPSDVSPAQDDTAILVSCKDLL